LLFIGNLAETENFLKSGLESQRLTIAESKSVRDFVIDLSFETKRKFG